MKRFIILYIMCIFLFQIFPQETYLVKIKPEKTTLLSGTSMEKRMDIKNKSYTFTPSYPGTNNPELQCLYDVVLNDDEQEEIISSLSESDIFDEIQKYEIAYTTCENPVSINDEKIVNGSIDNYALEIINAPCAWSVTKGDSRIIIGIADTDFQETHEDLQNQIISVQGEISAKQSHGTHVAGAAAAETNNEKGIAGVGYEAKIAGYRIKHTVTERGTTANSSDIKNAIWQAFLDGRKIINVSWSGTGLDKIAVKDIVDNGTTLVLSAGNSATDKNHSAIADIPGVIIVSSSNKDDEYYTGHARNQYVDICAPGRGVALTGLNNTYLNGNGTSFAAPLVAGTVALMLSINPCLAPAEIESIIEGTADPLKNAASYPGLIGSGRLNAYAAVCEVISRGTTYIQNTRYTSNRLITAETVIKAGNNVTDTMTKGNVVINNGTNLTLRATKGIELHPGFEVSRGATFNAEIYEPNCY